jgi:hypothetical protein
MATTSQSTLNAQWSSVTFARAPPFLHRRLIPNFNNSVAREHLPLELRQFEDILRFVRTNLRVWSYTVYRVWGQITCDTTKDETTFLILYGKYPKENIQDSEHGENLKSRITWESHNLQTTPAFRFLSNIPVSHFTLSSCCDVIPRQEISPSFMAPLYYCRVQSSSPMTAVFIHTNLVHIFILISLR